MTTETILNTGITIDIGGVEVTFRMLPIAEDMEWRRGIGRIVSTVVKRQLLRDADFEAELIAYFFGDGMDDLIKSVFELADKPLDVVVATATRQEISSAVAEVYKAYYVPFVSSVVEIWGTLRPGNG